MNSFVLFFSAFISLAIGPPLELNQVGEEYLIQNSRHPRYYSYRQNLGSDRNSENRRNSISQYPFHQSGVFSDEYQRFAASQYQRMLDSPQYQQTINPSEYQRQLSLAQYQQQSASSPYRKSPSSPRHSSPSYSHPIYLLGTGGYSALSMRDLNLAGRLSGAGGAQSLSFLRPYYSTFEMTVDGDRGGFGNYLQVGKHTCFHPFQSTPIQLLPDEQLGDKPIYTWGGSFERGKEPISIHHGLVTRPFG